MYINTNKKELLQLAKYFYHITHTLISIYDEKENLICSYPDTMCDFCTEIRKDPQLKSLCLQNDRTAFEVCKATRKTYIYHCHMGLLEVATPIIYKNVIIGYMLFGQITDAENNSHLFSEIQNILRRHQLPEQKMQTFLSKIHSHSRDYIESIAKLLEMCANYIWLNSIISIRKEDIALRIDGYIKEHLGETLSVTDLCRRFNIGRSTLYEISQKNFGCSIGNYIRYQRNEAAKELLLQKELSVTQIAQAVGINDPNYFIRFFKKQNGCTPKAWQKNKADTSPLFSEIDLP